MKIALCALLALVVVGALADAHTLYHRQSAPAVWQQGARASPAATKTVVIALKQRNLDQLEAKFWAVADPRGADYQNFMTPAEIHAMIAPAQEQVDLVSGWLLSGDVPFAAITEQGDSIKAVMSVRSIERLFGVQMYEFTHTETEKTALIGMGKMSVPASLAAIVEMVVGISDFPVPRTPAKQSPSNGQAVAPQSAFAIYGIPFNPTVSSNTSQGVIEFESQNYSPSDLASFIQQSGTTTIPPTAADIIGTNDPTQPGVESMLDIEWIGIAGGAIQNWFWIEDPTAWLYTFTTHFMSTAVVPNVISISYAWSEANQCQDGIGAGECQQMGVDSIGFVQRLNTEWQKIGLRGVSIFVASGDSGTHGRTDGDCSNPAFFPDFPSSSPYVTSVGATQINNPTQLPNQPAICTSGGFQCVGAGGQEVAVSYDHANFASGGGFSNVASMPTYQTKAVNAYIHGGTALPPQAYWNATGRAFPDISSLGADMLIVAGGAVQTVGGTSCASPTVAGIFALFNDYVIGKTGKPLGFVNPLLYQMWGDQPSAFIDITSGDNACTEQGCNCAPGAGGFTAAAGWDPVTGLGSPNFNVMQSYIHSHFAKIAKQ